VLLDEFPEVQCGDMVQMRCALYDEGVLVARKGDVGHVIDKQAGCWPTIRFDRTERICDASPEEFEVLCDAGFAHDAKSTPAKPMKKFARRGAPGARHAN
jgi:hypothetical protein